MAYTPSIINADIGKIGLQAAEEFSKPQKPKSRFDISEFRSEIKLNGVLQNNRFVMVMAMPKGIDKLSKYSAVSAENNDNNSKRKTLVDNDNFITLRCDTVTVPGVNFFTNDNIRRYGFGQIEKRPYLPTFNPITLSFIVDRNAKVISFFNDWANNIVDHDTDFGVSPAGVTGVNNGYNSRPYLLRYSDDFMSKVIRVWVYDHSNAVSFGIKLYDCFPLTTSDIDLDWGSQNQIINMKVVMQFSHMSMQFVNHVEGDPSSPKGSSEVYDDSINENKRPSLINSILDQTGKLVQGEIYSGAERYINKTFDKIFK